MRHRGSSDYSDSEKSYDPISLARIIHIFDHQTYGSQPVHDIGGYFIWDGIVIILCARRLEVEMRFLESCRE